MLKQPFTLCMLVKCIGPLLAEYGLCTLAFVGKVPQWGLSQEQGRRKLFPVEAQGKALGSD